MSQNEEITSFYRDAKESTARILGRHRIPPTDAEDILQEIFLRLVRDWEEIHQPHRWLAKTLKFRCIDYWRDRRKRLFKDIDECATELLQDGFRREADETGLKMDIQLLLKNLRKRCRELLQLRFGMGLSSKEISPMIGCRVSSIPRLTQRCKTSFSRVLAKTSYQRSP